jgi:hypothetical protein
LLAADAPTVKRPLRDTADMARRKECAVKQVIAIAAIALFLTASPALSVDNDAEVKAQEAAKSWLALVDSGKFGQSWDRAAALFQAAVTKAGWEKAVAAARSPLGALKSRNVRSATFARTLPGAPDGEYVVIQYDSQFENKASATETVTPMQEKDGSWKVSGYYIR